MDVQEVSVMTVAAAFAIALPAKMVDLVRYKPLDDAIKKYGSTSYLRIGQVLKWPPIKLKCESFHST